VKKTYKPKVQTSARFTEEEFEVYGNKKNKKAYSDSDSDEDRIPNLLLVKISPDREELS